MQKLCAMDDVEGWNSGNLHPLICQLWTWHDFSSIYYIATYSRYTTYLSIYLFINCLFTGVLDPSVVGVVKRFTIKTLFAKHVIKCTTFDVSLVLCVANNYQPERSCISNLETRDSSAKITTSNKVSWNYKLFIVLRIYRSQIGFAQNISIK